MNRSYKYPLDKFVGKDIWVKVSETIKYGLGGERSSHSVTSWIRIISDSSDCYNLNIINDRRIARNGFYECSDSERNKILNTSFMFKKAYFEICEPLDCLTTDEIFGTF